MRTRPVRALWLAMLLAVSLGARSSTPNFVVETEDPQICMQIAQTAEAYRRDVAIQWLGNAMPNWSAPCVMTVQVGPQFGPGGATTFVFDRGEVFGWRMTIQGSAQRVLDSVLPHEITHMVLASYFRRPVPRWADEGAATAAEHEAEKGKHRKMLVQFLQTGRGIAFSRMFAMKEYPPDVMPLYAQGFSLADYLIETGGRPKFLQFLTAGMAEDQWSAAVVAHYGLNDLGVLQNTWLTWVRQGSPRIEQPKAAPVLVAQDTSKLLTRPEPNLVLRQPKPAEAAQAGRQTAASAGWFPGSTRPWTGGPLPTQLTRPQPIATPGGQ
jgi:hypothetical protein